MSDVHQSIYKVSIKDKHDHILYYDDNDMYIIKNIMTGKTFTDIHDAIRDISNGVVMLLTFLGIEFDIPNKGSIMMEDITCDRKSISSIYSHLTYLSTIQCDIETYIKLRRFIDDIIDNDSDNIIDILMLSMSIDDSYSITYYKLDDRHNILLNFVNLISEQGNMKMIKLLTCLCELYTK